MSTSTGLEKAPTTWSQAAFTADGIKWWDDYAKEDRYKVSDYLFDSGEPTPPIGEYEVDVSDFTSREQHEREVAGLWTKVWQAACRANEIPEVGDFLEYEIVGYSILVVRDTPTTVKAFHNACRHRATAVASGCGTASCFVCPFHGWTYGLDGSLQSLPAEWDFPHVDQSTHGLKPVLAEVFNGWVYINLDTTAAPLREFLGETITRHLLVNPTERMQMVSHVGIVVRSNWKVITEAFMETYHVTVTHPTGNAFSGDVQARYDAFGLHQRFCSLIGVPGGIVGEQFTEQEVLEEAIAFQRSLRGMPDDGNYPELPEGVTARQFLADQMRALWGAQGYDVSNVSDAEMADVIEYTIFPNLNLVVHPISQSALRFRPNGDDHTTSIAEFMRFRLIPEGQDMPKDAPLLMLGPDDKLADHEEQMGGTGFIADQDVSNCARVQKGLRSLDKLVLAQKQERNIVAFHRNLAAFIAEHA